MATPYLLNTRGEAVVSELYALQYACKHEYHRLKDLEMDRRQAETIYSQVEQPTAEEEVAEARSLSINLKQQHQRTAPTIDNSMEELGDRATRELARLNGLSKSGQQDADRRAVRKARRAAWLYLDATKEESTSEELAGITIAQGPVQASLKADHILSLEQLQLLMEDSSREEFNLSQVCRRLITVSASRHELEEELSTSKNSLDTVKSQLRTATEKNQSKTQQILELERTEKELTQGLKFVKDARDKIQEQLIQADEALGSSIRKTDYDSMFAQLKKKHGEALETERISWRNDSDRRLSNLKSTHGVELAELREQQEIERNRLREAKTTAEAKADSAETREQSARSRVADMELQIVSLQAQSAQGEDAKNERISELSGQLSKERALGDERLNDKNQYCAQVSRLNEDVAEQKRKLSETETQSKRREQAKAEEMAKLAEGNRLLTEEVETLRQGADVLREAQQENSHLRDTKTAIERNLEAALAREATIQEQLKLSQEQQANMTRQVKKATADVREMTAERDGMSKSVRHADGRYNRLEFEFRQMKKETHSRQKRLEESKAKTEHEPEVVASDEARAIDTLTDVVRELSLGDIVDGNVLEAVRKMKLKQQQDASQLHMDTLSTQKKLIEAFRSAALVVTEEALAETTVRRIVQGICETNSTTSSTTRVSLVVQSQAWQWDISKVDGHHLLCGGSEDPHKATRKLWLHACSLSDGLASALQLTEQVRQNLVNRDNDDNDDNARYVLAATHQFTKRLVEMANNTPEQTLRTLGFILCRCMELLLRMRARVSLQELQQLHTQILAAMPAELPGTEQPLLGGLLEWLRQVLYEPEKAQSLLRIVSALPYLSPRLQTIQIYPSPMATEHS